MRVSHHLRDSAYSALGELKISRIIPLETSFVSRTVANRNRVNLRRLGCLAPGISLPKVRKAFGVTWRTAVQIRLQALRQLKKA
jgi:hypothetical protein